MARVVSPARSGNMARIRGKDTDPEVRLRRELWRSGLRYRKHYKVEGLRPDIVFPSKRVAIFVDGCFWHGCPNHYVPPSAGSEFWAAKLTANISRDKAQTLRLQAHGWRVIRIWEHEINSSMS